MIDLKEYILKNTDGFWNRLKIKLGQGLPANYACRNLQDFLANRDRMKTMDVILLPKLIYFPGPDEVRDSSFDAMPMFLQDESAKVEAWARYTTLNLGERRFMQESLKELVSGQAIYFPTIRNGMLTPGIIEPNQTDNTIYLDGFQTFWTKRRKSALSRVLSGLESLVPDFRLPEPIPVPEVRR